MFLFSTDLNIGLFAEQSMILLEMDVESAINSVEDERLVQEYARLALVGSGPENFSPNSPVAGSESNGDHVQSMPVAQQFSKTAPIIDDEGENKTPVFTFRNTSTLITSLEDLDNFDKVRNLLYQIEFHAKQLVAPSYNEWKFAQCEICLDNKWLLVRQCCHTPTCTDCLSEYYKSKIEMGAISIPCIGDGCDQLVYRNEISIRLPLKTRDLYSRLLLARSTECKTSKPCPQCNTILKLDDVQQAEMAEADKKRKGLRKYFKRKVNEVSNSLFFK